VRITERAERRLAQLPPDLADAVRAQLARVRDPTDEELRRLAALLGLRRPAVAPHDETRRP
jgi:hypothetical protein